MTQKQKTLTPRDDPVEWIKKNLGFEPDVNQSKIIRDKSLKIIVAAGRRFGKSAMGAAYAIWWAQCMGNRQKIMVFGPGWEEVDAFREQMIDFLEDAPNQNIIRNIKRDWRGNIPKREMIFTNTNSRVLFRAATDRSAGKRGRGADLKIMEEAAFISDESMTAIRPVSLDRAGKELMISTPIQRNHFYQAYTSGVYKVYHFKTIDSPRIDKARLEEDRKLMTKEEFRREYEAEFVEDHRALIPLSVIDDAVDPSIEILQAGKSDCSYVLGVDLGRTSDSSAIVVVEQKENVSRVVHVTELKNNHSDTFWTNVLEKTATIAKNFRATKIRIDATTMGDMPTLELRRKIQSEQIPCIVEGIVFSKVSKIAMVDEGLVLKIENGLLRFPNLPIIKKQLSNIRVESTKFGGKVYRHVGHDDVVMAMALACSGTTIDGSEGIAPLTNKRKNWEDEEEAIDVVLVGVDDVCEMRGPMEKKRNEWNIKVSDRNDDVERGVTTKDSIPADLLFKD